MSALKCDVILIGLAAALAGVAVWSHRQDEARLRVLRLEADSLGRAIKDSSAVYYHQRLADTSRIRAQAEQILRLRASYNRTIVHTDSVVDTLVLAGDTAGVRQLIDAERKAAAAIIDTLTANLSWAHTRIAFWRDTALVQRSAQLDASQALLARALAAKRPSRFWTGVAVGAAAVGVVLVVR